VRLLARLLFAQSPTLVNTVAATLALIVDMEQGLPDEVAAELLAAGGVERLLDLLPSEEEAAFGDAAEAHKALAATLCALAVNPAVGEAVCTHGSHGASPL
jgi:hypothetical protein